MRTARWPGSLLWLLFAGLVACGQPIATAEPVLLQATGSASMAPLVAELAAAFQQRSPGVQIEVQGLDTAFGLQALRAGEVDFALASWPPAESEIETSGWQERAIARDAIAVVVHPGNPLAGLGLLQLRDLFSGRVYDWGAVAAPGSLGEVLVISREPGSGTRAAFEALVMEERAVTPRALLGLSPQAVIDAVAAEPGAIGYLALGDVTPEVRVLAIEGVLPTPASAVDGTYPLTRDLWIVALAPPPAPVQQFLDFVLSPAGQEIVARSYGKVR